MTGPRTVSKQLLLPCADCLPLTGDPTTGVIFSNVSCPVNYCISSISAQQFNYGGIPTFGG